VTLSATPPTAASQNAETAAAEKAFAAASGRPAGEALDFPATAPAANPVFYRTYSRKTETGRESWHQVAERNLGVRKKARERNNFNADGWIGVICGIDDWMKYYFL